MHKITFSKKDRILYYKLLDEININDIDTSFIKFDNSNLTMYIKDENIYSILRNKVKEIKKECY